MLDRGVHISKIGLQPTLISKVGVPNVTTKVLAGHGDESVMPSTTKVLASHGDESVMPSTTKVLASHGEESVMPPLTYIAP